MLSSFRGIVFVNWRYSDTFRLLFDHSPPQADLSL
jgi:hypothetical protein